MECRASMHSHLEQMLHDKSIEPKDLPLSLLNDITNNFSEDQQVGKGGFAVVYKGALGNGGTVAVKKLDQKVCIDEDKFIKEVGCLMSVKHKNIVRFLGYCSDTQGKMSDYGGKFVMADVRQRLLCFEYHPNGSLDKYITEVSGGLEWRMRYKIIRGICAALHYLHEKRIVHLDLKPANILLDNGMVPKIADFGLSRCFEENQSRTITSKVVGSIGYLAPEFYNGVVTFKSDIYSLGVIIMEILTGHKGYSSVKNVRESWRNRLKQSPQDTLLEEISVCAEIGIQCIDANPDIRPDTLRIIEMLDGVESTHDSTETGMSTSLFMQDGESIVLPKRIRGRTSQVRSHADAVFLAVSKIGSISAEVATRAVVTKLLEKDAILKELPRRIEEIGKELKMMDLVIKDIGTPSLNNELVSRWIAEVRDLAHRVEDVFDKYSYNAFQLEEENRVKNIITNRVKKILIKSHYITVFSEIAEEVTEIEKSIESVVKRKERWLPQSQLSPNLPAYIERMQSQDFLWDVVQDDLVGIEENRRLLTEWLNSDEQISKIITVFGMGGLGKTTLVTNVYEREKFNFTTYAWIVVSQTYYVVELLRELLRMVGDREQSQIVDLDANDMKVKINERLAGRKCLIVLDDVWNQEAYTQICDAFHNLLASWVIITTRQEQVAALAHPTRQLKLKPLEHSDALVLFCRKAFYGRMNFKCPDELEKLANNMVDRCQGLPLAIVTMGGLLSTRPPVKHVWNETYKQFHDELTDNDRVRAILNLSYHDLPGNLRNCFFYCSLFPKYHLMSRERLVWLWVAEGFAVQNEESTPEEVADRYLRELIQRNMLEAVENDELGRVRTCKMHDLLHDLALSVAKEEKFGFAYDFGTLVKMDKGVRRLSSCRWKDKTSLQVKILLPRLRTLVALGIIESSSPQLLYSVLSESMYLTVLELQDSEIIEVPESIGNMFSLRYIGLRRTRVRSLPESIGKLSNLQTLDIKQTKIEKLPRGIVKIKKLRHLLADTYADEKQSQFRYFIGLQAPKELSNFEELQTLETVEANKDLAEQLIKLTKLMNVWIDNISEADCSNLFSVLSKMPLLSTLLLSASDENGILHLEALKPVSENFHRLIIRGCWADNSLQCPVFHDWGRNLKYLGISWCRLQEDPLQLLAPYVPNLTYLSLNRVSSANTLVLSKGCFPELKTLVLKWMLNVEKVEIRLGALQQIEGLYVVSLLKLDKVPQGIESLRSLKKLWLLGLHKDFRGQWDSKEMQQKMQYIPEVRI